MNILPIKTYNSTINKNNMQNKVNNNIPSNSIHFKSGKYDKLWQEYNHSINNDKLPAIFSFLRLKEMPEVMDAFLNAILSIKDRSAEFISSIVSHPRENNSIQAKLSKILPNESINLMPFLCFSPYNKAYTDFIHSKAEQATSLEELLKIRPDWQGDLLLRKAEQLNINESLTIGNIPKEIPPKHLDFIVDSLRGEMQFGIKFVKNINDIILDGRTYSFQYFVDGKSDKNVFGITTPEGKRYILKMNRPEERSLDAPFALGTLAKIDSYLALNKCRNSAPLRYYNHEQNFSIYEFIEHDFNGVESSDLNVIRKKIPDFYALNLNYNDTVGAKNFFNLTQKSNSEMTQAEGFTDGLKNGEWITVDNDHVTYNNRLQPMISDLHSPLPNAMQMFF